MKTLTVCIPTYNRVDHLKKCLESLEKQKFNPFISVIISDNASTDKTESFLRHYIKNAVFKIEYFRNKSNLGFDGNILNLYQKATSDYVWFLSDDDFILPEKIQYIWRLLNTFKPTALHPNIISDGKTNLLDGHFTTMTHYSKKIGYKLEVGKLLYPKTQSDILSCCRLLSFISCCVVKRDPKITQQLDSFVGTGILQDAILTMNLKQSPSVFIAKEATVIGGEKKFFSKWFMESVLFGTYALYSNPKLGYPQNLAKIVGRDTVLFALSILSNAKTKSQYFLSFKEVVKLLKMYKLNSIYFLPTLIRVLALR